MAGFCVRSGGPWVP